MALTFWTATIYGISTNLKYFRAVLRGSLVGPHSKAVRLGRSVIMIVLFAIWGGTLETGVSVPRSVRFRVQAQLAPECAIRTLVLS